MNVDVPICVNNIHEEALAFARVCLGRIRLEFKNLAGGEVSGIFAGEPGAVSLALLKGRIYKLNQDAKVCV